MYDSGDDETETKRLRLLQQQQSFFFSLAEELIIEILSWLPLDSVMRFKCVSKSWNSLISHPSFIQLHSHRSSELPHRLILFKTLQHDDKTTFAASYASVRTPAYILKLIELKNQYYTALGSCNGLVCLLHSKCREDSHFLLWNPATRLLSQKFPCFCQITPPHSREKYGYDKFGFGYDKWSHTYKVVWLRYLGDRTQAKVYTLGGGGGGGGWRVIQRFPAFPFHNKTEGTFLSGTLNWVAMRNFVIVSLDLGTETYKQFSLPPFGCDEMPPYPSKFDQRRFETVLEVFLDCLCLSYDYNNTHFIMWQMKEFGVEKSWTRFVKVSYQHLQLERGLRRMACLCISENGDVLVLRKNHSEIILYNRRDNRVQLTPYPTSNNKISETIYVNGYAPSLVSPY